MIAPSMFDQDEDLVLVPDAKLRTKLFGSAVLAHPAKQSLTQLTHLLRRFAVPGGVLLDPFGGAGSAMLAASGAHGGMYVVSVEMAPHFIAMQEGAWNHFQTTFEMMDIYDIPPGDYMPLQGDSRKLAEVLRGLEGIEMPCADLVITSPSYGGSEAVDRRKTQNTTIAAHGGGNTARDGYVGSATAPMIPRLGAEYRTHGLSPHSQLSAKMHSYAPSNQQIERLPTPMTPRWGGNHAFGPHSQLSAKQYSYEPPVDLVITSPPYMDALSDKRNQQERRLQKAQESGDLLFAESVRPNSQVSRVQSYDPPVDLVITSPPYQDTLSPEHRQRGRYQREASLTVGTDDRGFFKDMDAKAVSRAQSVIGYDDNPSNIGNERGTKYLNSMRQVWQQCAMVTKPGAILCCITRDCVREGKRVPVGDQNRELLEEAGFRLLEIERWGIPHPSFWRILHQKKRPGAPVIDVEEVSICQRAA